MSDDLYLVFSDPADTVNLETFNSFQEQHVLENLEVAGFVSCRRYALRRIRGDEYPARYRFLSAYEVDKPREELREGLRERSTRRVRPEWLKDVELSSQTCKQLDGGPDPTKPNRLFFTFSTPPTGMTFDAYSEWYGEHQQENIRATARLHQGWRYRLTEGTGGDTEVPPHCAIYELEGPAEEMLVDTNRAVEAGETGMLEGFHMFANFEATALDERHIARR